MSQIKQGTTFRGDVLRLVSGTALAQGLGILASPLLTRLYGPDAFGVAALFASFAGILGVAACLRYELAIVLPENDEDAANIFGLALLSSFGVSLLLILPVWLLGPQAAAWVHMPDIAPYFWLLPLSVFIQGIYLALNYWNTRTKQFIRLSFARVGQSTTNVGTNLAVGYAGHADGGNMIVASILGQVMGVFVLGVQIFRDYGAWFVKNIHWAKMRDQAIRHHKFPKFSVLSGLLNVASFQVPVMMLAAYFGPKVLGLYALGFRLLQTPLNLVGSAVAQVFIQQAAQARNQGTLASVVVTLLQKLILIGFVPLFALSLIGRDVFTVCFGHEWAEAGVYVQILSAWAFCQFISSPLSQLFAVLEKQGFGLRINIALVATRISSILIGGIWSDVTISLAIFSFTGVLVYGYMLFYALRYSGVMAHHFTGYFRILLPRIGFSSIMILMASLLLPSVCWRLAMILLLVVAYFLILASDEGKSRHRPGAI